MDEKAKKFQEDQVYSAYLRGYTITLSGGIVDSQAFDNKVVNVDQAMAITLGVSHAKAKREKWGRRSEVLRWVEFNLTAPPESEEGQGSEAPKKAAMRLPTG